MGDRTERADDLQARIGHLLQHLGEGADGQPMPLARVDDAERQDRMAATVRVAGGGEFPEEDPLRNDHRRGADAPSDLAGDIVGVDDDSARTAHLISLDETIEVMPQQSGETRVAPPRLPGLLLGDPVHGPHHRDLGAMAGRQQQRLEEPRSV